jgi:hypothetical protein
MNLGIVISVYKARTVSEHTNILNLCSNPRQGIDDYPCFCVYFLYFVCKVFVMGQRALPTYKKFTGELKVNPPPRWIIHYDMDMKGGVEVYYTSVLHGGEG